MAIFADTFWTQHEKIYKTQFMKKSSESRHLFDGYFLRARVSKSLPQARLQVLQNSEGWIA